MIRKATTDDIDQIKDIIEPYASLGKMLPRNFNDLYENIRDFSVYEKDKNMKGIIALHVSWKDISEIRSLAIKDDYLSTGIGTALVNFSLQEARSLHIKKVFVLTYTPDFFKKQGFLPIEKEELPHKIWKDCVNCSKFPSCDEQALIIEV